MRLSVFSKCYDCANGSGYYLLIIIIFTFDLSELIKFSNRPFGSV